MHSLRIGLVNHGGRMAEQKSTGQASQAARAEGPWTTRRLLAWMNTFLTEKGIDSPRHVAEILLAHVLRIERLGLYMDPDRELDPVELKQLRELVARAAKHEPVQFLVGRWTFFGRDFDVAPCTLIPRPCTERLVERALAWYRERGAGPARVLDLCTGTGCIAVSLALGMRAIARPSGAGCRPISAKSVGQVGGSRADEGFRADEGVRADEERLVTVVASDVVPDAVALAARNAARLGASVESRCGDLWAALSDGEQFDLVVSNPPYVSDSEYAELEPNVKEYEPATALRGGRDGLDFVRRIAEQAAARVRARGLLLVEIGWKQGASARSIFAGGEWSSVELIRDDEGHERVLVAVRAG